MTNNTQYTDVMNAITTPSLFYEISLSNRKYFPTQNLWLTRFRNMTLMLLEFQTLIVKYSNSKINY